MILYYIKRSIYGTFYYLNNVIHRENGLAIEMSNGDKHWYLNGELNREDGPAIEYFNGNKYWYKHGKLHQKD